MARITLAGESLIAQKQGAQQVLQIARFIYANVPGLDPQMPIDRAAGKPPAGQIVHTYTIPPENTGYVNPNQVVFSSMLGSDIGDFDWNWLGLESAEGVLFAVAYVPLQQKRKNIPPAQIGNNVTRNILVEFSGAQELTGITIDASTWQHDFTVRLAGIDERERRSNRDIFGRACFFSSAFQVEKVGSTYSIKPGVAYIEGVRIELAATQVVAVPATPVRAWLDVSLRKASNDVAASFEVVFGPGKVDYVDAAGTRHYLVPLADLTGSAVIDLRVGEPIEGELIKHFAARVGDYPGLRARATTKADVGLDQVPNAVTDFPESDSLGVLASTSFVKRVVADARFLSPAVRNVAQGGTGQDPNLTVDPVIITNHANSPGRGVYWHITTTFYAVINAEANRGQLAVAYNHSIPEVWARSCYLGMWLPWIPLYNLESPEFKGIPTAPTAALGNSSKQLATTEFVMRSHTPLAEAVAGRLPLAGGKMLGTIESQAGTIIKAVSTTGESRGYLFSGDEGFGLLTSQGGWALRLLPDSTGIAFVGSMNGNGSGLTEIPLAGVVGLIAALAAKAPLASPTFTGSPTAPTPPLAVSNQQLATTEFVSRAVAALVDSSPDALNTLRELAAALGNDPNFATTMLNNLAAKAPLASPALTGSPTAPTATLGNSSTHLATTEFVKQVAAAAQFLSPATRGLAQGSIGQNPDLAVDQVILTSHARAPHSAGSVWWHITTTFYGDISATANRGQTALSYNGAVAEVWSRSCFNEIWLPWVPLYNLESPVFKGVPTAPTAALGNRSAQLATTEFVQDNGTPVGAVMVYASSTPPVGYLKANGAEVNRALYARLFAAIGTTFGAGDGITTFNLPDLRGEFIRGWDDARGADPARAFGSWQKGSLVLSDHIASYVNIAVPITSTNVPDAEMLARQGLDTVNVANYPSLNVASTSNTILTAGLTAAGFAAGSSRPRNLALLACIRY